MNISNYDITFQEVPDEISLCLLVGGCPLHCKGCSSKYSWHGGKAFDICKLNKMIDKYGLYISCVCFLGGEWCHELPDMLREVHNRGLKTCLYTGHKEVPKEIMDNLDYIKTGPWIESRGGLDKKDTNQEFWDLNKHEKINYKFYVL